MIERSFVRIKSGLVHVAACGAGRPILLLHQTPRSWDEYREVLPLLGARYRAIAMDTVGFGDSQPLPAGTDSIEAWAEAAHEVLAALGHARAVVAGHHTGAAIAVEMAASRPERVEALVLSACPYVDAARRATEPGRRVIDEVAAACRRPASSGIVGEAAALLSGGPRRSSRTLHRRCLEGGAARRRRPSRRRPLRDGAAPAAGALPDPGDRAHGRPACPSACADRRRQHRRQQIDRDRSGHGAASRPYAARLRGCDRPVPVEPASRRTESPSLKPRCFNPKVSAKTRVKAGRRRKRPLRRNICRKRDGRLTGKSFTT